MKTKTENLLPKILQGTVHTQFVRCGKENCKCARGELHGAYYYHFVRVDGKLRKRYLKASKVEEIQKACLSRQEHERAQREDTKSVWQLIRQLRENLRETSNLYILRGQANDTEK
jgi:hypothetical protein